MASLTAVMMVVMMMMMTLRVRVHLEFVGKKCRLRRESVPLPSNGMRFGCKMFDTSGLRVNDLILRVDSASADVHW
jgi:hypothetical protein